MARLKTASRHTAPAVDYGMIRSFGTYGKVRLGVAADTTRL
ncbi:hypothetical protein ACQPZF_30545 [Actinosynnema sp. CS-041913]